MSTLTSLAPDAVTVGGLFGGRAGVNRKYVLSLTNENLLQNYKLEAGLGQIQLYGTYNGGTSDGREFHWGWESPGCQVRGHFPGHWLSAASRLYANSRDPLVKIRIDEFVDGLAACQKHNGGEWAGPIPEKYITGLAEGRYVWAPHYTIHKSLMGLVDAYVWGQSKPALKILTHWAKWFHRWTKKFTRDQMDDILDFETGGMLESWANLYAITGKQAHRDLIERYTRHRLFDPLVKGVDALTNMHANTTIPEAAGCARAYEVTGDQKYRRMVEAYWKCAVTDRGMFCTGGQNQGEIWTPPFEFAARLGDKNQEFCTVYNMVRVADYLLRWTGKSEYADYIERNLYNGFAAQQHPETGMVTYWLEMQPGGKKRWGSPTYDFWCCYGTLVQSHTLYGDWVFYEGDDSVTVAQYVDSTATLERPEGKVTLRQSTDPQAGGFDTKTGKSVGSDHRPQHLAMKLTIKADAPSQFTLKLRVPWWVAGKPTITVNGKAVTAAASAGYISIRRKWSDDTVSVTLPMSLWTDPIPDEPGTVAFMYGPCVLAGLVDEKRTLIGDVKKPETILKPACERQWGSWMNNWQAAGQASNFRFIPLHEVIDETFTLYFPVKKA